MYKEPGIYQITNLKTHRQYISRTSDLLTVWKKHQIEFVRQEHFSPSMQDDYNKYGISSFRFYILKKTSPTDDVEALENEYIQQRIDSDIDMTYMITHEGEPAPKRRKSKKSK